MDAPKMFADEVRKHSDKILANVMRRLPDMDLLMLVLKDTAPTSNKKPVRQRAPRKPAAKKLDGLPAPREELKHLPVAGRIVDILSRMKLGATAGQIQKTLGITRGQLRHALAGLYKHKEIFKAGKHSTVCWAMSQVQADATLREMLQK